MRVCVWLLMSSFACCLAFTSAQAHEVQPTVSDITIDGQAVTIDLDWVLEAPVAGVDLEGLADTNASEEAEAYDALRALSPTNLEQSFRDAWPDIAEKFTLRSGDLNVTPELQGVAIPEVGDVAIARISEVQLSATLPEGDAPVVFGWSADLGPLVVRQQGAENAYSGYLVAGDLSDPIPRTGGEAQTAGEAFFDYIGVGFDHIIPLGLDHILFVLGLFFLALKMGPLLWQITAFTLAHTVTLALGALDIVRVSPDIVEPLIAASIVYVGIENVLSRGLTPWRPFVVFCFGLLHGLGFASVLSDFGLGADHFVPKLIGFNLGVEIGQLAVIGTAFIAFGVLFGSHAWYRRRISAPVSIGISVIALFWVFERTGAIDLSGVFAPFSMLTEGGFDPYWVAVTVGGIALILTVLEMSVGADRMRDVCGFVTSFVMFMGVVATFTSGAWILTAALTGGWILALRLQSLGGPDDHEVLA